MRPLFLNSVREFGGGERWLLETAAGLYDRGHDPLIVCRPEAGWQEAAAARGLPVHPVPLPHDFSPVAAGRLAGLLRGHRADVLVCCTQRAVRLGVPAARLAGGVPVVFRNGLRGSFRAGPLNRLAARGIARFVVNSAAVAAELAAEDWIPPPFRISIIRNGVHISPDGAADSPGGPPPWERGHPCPPGRAGGPMQRSTTAPCGQGCPRSQDGTAALRARWQLPPGSLVIAAAGRLVREKGYADLLAAVALLAPQHPEIRLVLMGEGPDEPRLREAIEPLGLQRLVRLTGFEPDLPAALAAADLFCQPSHREGLPNAVLEAMAAGLPVVATAVDGTPEAVRFGETGLLVPPADPAALASALSTLLARPGLRARFGQRARQVVRERFSLAASLDRWEALLEEVAALSTHPARVPLLRGRRAAHSTGTP